MSEQLLNHAEVGTVPKEECCDRVPEHVRGHTARETRLTSQCLNDRAHALRTKAAAAMVDEHRFAARPLGGLGLLVLVLRFQRTLLAARDLGRRRDPPRSLGDPPAG